MFLNCLPSALDFKTTTLWLEIVIKFEGRLTSVKHTGAVPELVMKLKKKPAFNIAR